MNVDFHPNANDLVLSRSEVRAIDAAAIESLGIPGLLLMENAARGVSEQLCRVCMTDQVAIICGPGNNGGDGLALARQRAAEGNTSRILLETAGKSLSDDTRTNLEFLKNAGVPVQVLNCVLECRDLLSDLTSDDWIIDSLLGTGVQGELRPPYISWVQAINASPAHVLAVDVPSGLDCDDGSCAEHCVRAELTVTFVGMKRGFLAASASKQTGRVVVAPIGLPERWVREWLLQRRGNDL